MIKTPRSVNGTASGCQMRRMRMLKQPRHSVKLRRDGEQQRPKHFKQSPILLAVIGQQRDQIVTQQRANASRKAKPLLRNLGPVELIELQPIQPGQLQREPDCNSKLSLSGSVWRERSN